MEGKMIIHLHDKEARDPAIVGGKAASLARWLKEFRIPSGVVVLPVKGPLETLQVTEGMTYAVRSSAVDEDGPQHSFAGQHDTYLNVHPDDVFHRVLDCYESAYSDRAKAYRREHGLPFDVKMAVIVQEMVQHVMSSGVMFSRDPLLGGDVAVIEADWGVGKVVDGEGSPAVYRVEGNQIIEEPHTVGKMVLADQMTRKIARMGTYIADQEGYPIDMEWAIDTAENVWLLQVRPITA
jgi:phosphoenolpyruvate synthase/pyruvate phosphate dikinase